MSFILSTIACTGLMAMCYWAGYTNGRDKGWWEAYKTYGCPHETEGAETDD